MQITLIRDSEILILQAVKMREMKAKETEKMQTKW